MWTRILALIVKELLTVLKDAPSRGVIFVLPIVQLCVFPHAATFEVPTVPVAVWNEDHQGKAAADFLAEVFGSPTFVRAAEVSSPQEAEARLDAKEVKLILHIGQDFSRALAQGGPAQLQAIVDGRNSNTSLIVLGYLSDVVTAFNAPRLQEMSTSGQIVLEQRAWFNPNLESKWFIVPGLLAMIIMVAVLAITSFSVAREKEVGTFQQLLVTPLRPLEILVGKLVPALIVGVIDTLAIVAFAHFVYGIPFRGSLGLMLLGVIAFLLAIAGIGLMISSLARTQQQALLGGFFFMVPTAILSGFATPIENMPEAVQWLTLINPMRYMMEISRGLFLKGLSADLVLAQVWPMALIALVNMALAVRMFRKRLS